MVTASCMSTATSPTGIENQSLTVFGASATADSPFPHPDNASATSNHPPVQIETGFAFFIVAMANAPFTQIQSP